MSEQLGHHGVDGTIVFGDNLDFLRTLPPKSVDLIYIDPPFNTGKTQVRRRLKTVRDDQAPDRIGFQGKGYRTELIGSQRFEDTFSDFRAFILPRLDEAHRVLKDSGSFFLHLDYREVHYCKVYLDQIFGRRSFINEIIWTYDYGARARQRWSPKHDNILWYAKDPDNYTFNYADIDRIPYMAPSLVGPEKAARGKTPTDTWWHTIVSPTGREKTGYPTQKPLGIIERIVRLHSRPGELVLDFFAGSGTVGEACAKLGRKFTLVDSSPDAIEVMKKRLGRFSPRVETTAGTKSPKASSKLAYASSPPSHVHVLAAAVWDYEDAALQGLRGPEKDLELVRNLFSSNSPLGVYKDAQITLLQNPTVENLRAALVDYAMGRSAKGDVLIFYFSGHGTVLGNNEFGFCLKDTRIRTDGGGCLPLSVLSFDTVVRTLTAVDVHPLFIIDACFSGKAGQNDQSKVLGAMQDDMHRAAASSYGLLCACYAEQLARDTDDGGAFTKAIHDAAQAGRGDGNHVRNPYLRVSEISQPVQQLLTTQGFPLSKLYLGPDLPDFPFVKNAAYNARTETLMGYHRDTLQLLWNNGTPREVSLDEINKKLGVSAYGNHSKLSYEAWDLVADGRDTKHRRLTTRGELFMQGKQKVPSCIQFDAVTGKWHRDPSATEVGPDEIGAKRAKKNATKARARRRRAS